MNKVGIFLSDDIADDFLDHDTHYVDKRAPKKARSAGSAVRPESQQRISAAEHKKRGELTRSTATPASVVSQRSLRQARRASSASSTQEREIEVIDIASEEEEMKSGENSSVNRVVKGEEAISGSAQLRKKT